MVCVHCKTVAKATLSPIIHHWKQQIQALLFTLLFSQKGRWQCDGGENRLHYWLTQDPTCPLVCCPMAIPKAFQGAERWAILFNSGLWGLSLGCEGSSSTKQNCAKRLPRKGSDVRLGVRGRSLWVPQSRAKIPGWKNDNGVVKLILLLWGVDEK